jgi:hypothetical protein
MAHDKVKLWKIILLNAEYIMPPGFNIDVNPE